MPTDLIVLAIAGLIGIGLSWLVLAYDHRQHMDRQHKALRSFYERD